MDRCTAEGVVFTVMKPIQAFTLIELLIVVAILGILAAIAVPNFKNALTRAKIAQVLGDMKTLETAVEAYRFENNAYSPPYYDPNNYADTFSPNQILWYWMTTPIRYLASIPSDPFVDSDNPPAQYQAGWGYAYDFYSTTYTNEGFPIPCLWGHSWRISSWGPNRLLDYAGCRASHGERARCVNGSVSYQYKSSNGIHSSGDIIRVGARHERAESYARRHNYAVGFCKIDNEI